MNRAALHRPGVVLSGLRWCLAVALTAVLHPLGALLTLVSPRRGHNVFATWARLMQRIFRVRAELADRNGGRYDNGPYVFVELNQRSLAEAFVVQSVIPVPFRLFTNIEFALLPIGWSAWLTGSVVVIRQWQRQRRQALERAIERVRAGNNFYISIEGARSQTGEPLPFKNGAALLAIRAGATIVPIVMSGADEVLPYGEWRVQSGTIRITLLEAISTRGMTADDRHVLTARLRQLLPPRDPN